MLDYQFSKMYPEAKIAIENKEISVQLHLSQKDLHTLYMACREEVKRLTELLKDKDNRSQENIDSISTLKRIEDLSCKAWMDCHRTISSLNHICKEDE